MEQIYLESQIAKIQLGSFKHTTSYVHLTAEKAAGSDAELYIVAELPLFNPAAIESCEKICLAIASTLKRSYRRPVTESSFENAIAQINEELGKLASLGQTHWVGKLNCIICVKEGRNLTVASCGKVAGFLLRNREFTDISCSPPASHPLKTFENFATGKIRLDDILILSTMQLFNYLAMDRIKTILTTGDFLTATQTIIEILKENAGPEVAFGALFNMQVPLGEAADEEIDLENYMVEKPAGHQNTLAKAWEYLKAIFAAESIRRTPKVNLPKISFAQKVRNFGGNTKNFVLKGRGIGNTAAKFWALARNTLNFGKFKEFSAEKKFFLISAAVLLLAVALSITAAVRLRGSRTNQELMAADLKQAQTLLANAQSSLLYNDTAATISYLNDAKSKIPATDGKLSSENKNLYAQVSGQVRELQQKMEKNAEAKVTDLGSLGAANSLIKLPEYAAAQINGQVISYNLNSGKIEDGTLRISDTAEDEIPAAANNKSLAVVYNGSGLRIWDYAAGSLGPVFSQSVPAKQDFAGMAYYAVNSRVYTVNAKTGQILSYIINGGALSKPLVSITDPGLSDAKDVAIDGSIYVLTGSGIKKYQAGKPAEFKMPFLTAPLSGRGKIYTDQDAKNIYILDAGNNRILILDKKGSLVATLKAREFTDLKDFMVLESAKTIYVLNGGSLLKVTY